MDVRGGQNAKSNFAPLVSVIIPTFNEFENVSKIAAAIGIALKGRNHEIVFVDDDSFDGTRAEVAKLAAAVPEFGSFIASAGVGFLLPSPKVCSAPPLHSWS